MRGKVSMVLRQASVWVERSSQLYLQILYERIESECEQDRCSSNNGEVPPV